jgi:diguanylate cyclase (GGDEF)-like protein
MVLMSPARPDEAVPFRDLVVRTLRPVVIGLVLTLLLMVGRGVGTALLQRDVAAVIAVEHDLSRAHEAMLDQQTGIRGWLLSGEARFLDPYRRGRADLEAANDQLLQRLVVLDDVSLAGVVKAVWDAQQGWQVEWAVPVAAGAAVDDADIDREKARFDAYRAAFNHANEVTDARIVRLQRLDRQLLLFGLSIQTAVLVLSAGVALHQRRRLQRAVVDPVEALLAAVHRIEGGEYTTPLPVEGPREVRGLGKGLAQMAVTLQRAELAQAERAEHLDAQAALSVQVLDLAHEFTARLDVAHVLEAIVGGFAELSGAGTVIVWLIDDDGMVAARHVGETGGRLVAALGEGIAGRAALHGATFVSTGDVVRRSEAAALADAVAVPMVGGGRTQAVVELRADAGAPLVLGTRLAALRTLAAQGGLALAASQLHGRAVQLGRTDGLTGLLNRRTFDVDAAAEVALSARHGRPLAIAMIDIDHFKAVNDTYGHPTGDAVLRAVAERIAGSLRDSDTAYRYGGEEFAVLLRETDGPGALRVAERIRRDVERGFAGQDPAVTVSSGVAERSPAATDLTGVLEAADAALYAAKSEGRNRVRCADVGGGAPARSLGAVAAID